MKRTARKISRTGGVELLRKTTSTMEIARARVNTGTVVFDENEVPNSYGVMALEQTAGRGQRGRAWFSKPGESLSVTYYVRHGLADEKYLGHLSLMVGVAVARLLHDNALFCLEKTNADRVYKGVTEYLATPEIFKEPAPFRLKWPNDILLNGKKIAGILIERMEAPDGKPIFLVGVGVNVKNREFPEELQSIATSLSLEGVPTDCLNLQIWAEKLAELIAEEADICARTEGKSTLTRWRMRNDTWGRTYVAATETGEITGVAKGISEEGALILELPDGSKMSVSSATSNVS